MKNKDFLDLRFIIALFFSLIGLILFIGSLVLHTTVDKSENVNMWGGLAYIAFAVVMFLLWKYRTEDEEIEE